MNSAADDLALLLGVGDAVELVEEAVGGVDDLEPDAGGGDVVGLDLLALALAQQPVVDEDAGEVVADGPVHERRGDGRVDAAGQPADDELVADLRADRLDLLVDDVGRRPRRLDAGDVVEEVLEHRLAVLAVQHLGVELHAGEAARRGPRTPATGAPSVTATTREARRARGARRRRATSRPTASSGRAGEQRRARVGDAELGAAELREPGLRDLAAERARPSPGSRSRCRRSGTPVVEQRGVDLRGAVGVDRGRAAGEDHRGRVLREHLGHRHGRRDDLAVDVRLAHAAGDELGVLRTEVDDEDGAVRGGGHRDQRPFGRHRTAGGAPDRSRGRPPARRSRCVRSVDVELLIAPVATRIRSRHDAEHREPEGDEGEDACPPRRAPVGRLARVAPGAMPCAGLHDRATDAGDERRCRSRAGRGSRVPGPRSPCPCCSAVATAARRRRAGRRSAGGGGAAPYAGRQAGAAAGVPYAGGEAAAASRRTSPGGGGERVALGRRLVGVAQAGRVHLGSVAAAPGAGSAAGRTPTLARTTAPRGTKPRRPARRRRA